MLKLTRRVLIKQASIGAGAVGMLAATLAAKTSFENSSTTKAKAAGTSVLTHGEALVVYITDSTTGTLTVLRGEQETTITNAALVKHLFAL
jgi:predicted flavoprotein YhiN